MIRSLAMLRSAAWWGGGALLWELLQNNESHQPYP